MKTKYFYTDLPYVEDFRDITNERFFKDVPVDWHVIVTDIKGSTRAIEEGKYREVNFVAASATTAVLNVNKNVEFPFVFGGDGATILIPPEYLEEASDVLRDTQKFAKDYFNMNMRIGTVPVIDILRSRHKIRIVKLKVSDSYFQAVFHGGGLDHAEYLIKNDRKYLIPPRKVKTRANFSGLQCIWQDIPSKKDEIVSLLIKANPNTGEESRIYRDIMRELHKIYGKKEDRYPITDGAIKLKTNLKKIYLEALIESYQYEKPFGRIFFRRYIESIGNFFSHIFRRGLNTMPFRAYKSTVINSIDSEKFDDMLRMVITGTTEQRHQLVGFLEEKYQQGELAYGLHATSSIHMTCLIFERKGKHVHFIDGSNGGYTYAAKELKNRVKWQRIYMQTF